MPAVRPVTVCLIAPAALARAPDGIEWSVLPAGSIGLAFGATALPDTLPPGWQPMPGARDPLDALHKAQAYAPTHDIVLIGTEALPPPGWWPRLAAATASGGDFDVISALDHTVPALEPWMGEAQPPAPDVRDTLCWLLGDHAVSDCAWLSPALSWWRAGVADRVHGAWRARAPDHLRAGVLTSLYVSGSSGSESAAAELPAPVAALAERIALRQPQPALRPGCGQRPVLLHVVHGWGGGVWRFVRDMMRHDRERDHLALVSLGDPASGEHGQRIALHADLDHAPLCEWTLPVAIGDTALASSAYRALLQHVLARWGVGAVLVSSLIGHGLDALRSGRATAWCAHDCYPLWPFLGDDPLTEATAFDPPTLAARLASETPAPFVERDPAHWTRLRDAFVQALTEHDVVLVAPTQSAQDAVCRLVPALAVRRWARIGHGQAPWPSPPPEPPRIRTARALRVLVPGRIGIGKGERLLAQLLGKLPAGVELVLLGCGAAGMRFFGSAQVHVQLNYRHAELPMQVRALAPDLALLPSTVPETWSYTLSEMWSLGVPVMATALGSLAERIHDGETGLLVAPDADAIVAQLARLVRDRSALARLRPGVVPTLDTSLAAWARALPASLQLAQCDPHPAERLLAQHTLECALRRQRQELRAAREQETQTRAALDERTRWALTLEQEVSEHKQALAHGQRQAQRQQAELDARARWVLELQQQIAGQSNELQQWQQLAEALDHGEHTPAAVGARLQQMQEAIAAMQAQLQGLDRAHQYYQRDTRDLAQQRDVAIAQRDQLRKEIDGLLSSHSWRITRPVRGLRRLLSTALASLAFRRRLLLSLCRRGLASLRTRGVVVTSARVHDYLTRERAVPDAATTPALPATPVTALPCAEHPLASIIVPAYNHLDHTLACLAALANDRPRTPFEVIVVDDCSSDDTAQALAAIAGLRWHRNAENLGFIGACNAGAERARGRYLVFLNNDTQPRPGWLDALIESFATLPDAGLVGAKLIYPDGRLQEAGGIVFSDGSGWNYGRFADPADPRFNFVREVDYCSGAAIAIGRDLFEQLGGFDPHYAPAYYEDTDLAMKVRAHGLRVYYQPRAEVVHFEGVSSGTDLGSGIKAYQARNQHRFAARWREPLQRAHQPPGTPAPQASARTRLRRVLVIDACTPTPDRDSGSLRMLNLMRLLVAQGCAVSFLAENPAHGGAYTEALQQLGVEAWWHPWVSDPARWMSEHAARFDTVILSRHYVAAVYLPLIRRFAPKARVLFDTVDLHYLREQREAELSGDPARRRAAAGTREQELRLIRDTDATLVVSPYEQALLAREVPGARIEVLSNVHAVVGSRRDYAAREGLLFVGGYRHPPNVDAACWLVEQIFPHIRAALPEIELHLIGGDAPEHVRALGAQPGVRFHGHVPDLDPYLDGCRIALAPLRYGAGVKGKINQSMAHGQPVVATACAAEGMHLRDGHDVLVADDPQAFADAVVRLYRDPSLWQQLSDHGIENVREHYSFEAAGAAIARILGITAGT